MNARPVSPQRLDLRSRIAGLPQACFGLLQQGALLLDGGNVDAASEPLLAALAMAPTHPELLRMVGLLRYREQRLGDAIALYRQALSIWPDDAFVLGNLGSAQAGSGDAVGALATFRRATEVAPAFAPAWFNLGKQLEADNDTEPAAAALQRATEMAPTHVQARILYGETLNMLGRGGAADQFRAALRTDPHAARAWIGLVNLKTERLSSAETNALEASLARAPAGSEDRMILGFALGKALEDQGETTRAFGVFVDANAAKRATMPWDAGRYRRELEVTASLFARTVGQADDASLGQEVIFVVGLPRSGSTLVEQILASHPDVEGASELTDLEAVLFEESQRTGAPFPQWCNAATPADWTRLGRRYLQRTARWRRRRPRFTDKRPENWALAGAALAMLPGAHVVDCRRDPVETCWSCFKQLFGSGRLAATYDLADVAAYSLDHDALCDAWLRLHPTRFRVQRYESLVAEAEAQTRELLAFCDLSFDGATLRFHETERAIRTVSAAQVREPLRRDTALTSRYGALLDPLRRSLGEPRR